MTLVIILCVSIIILMVTLTIEVGVSKYSNEELHKAMYQQFLKLNNMEDSELSRKLYLDLVLNGI